MTSSNIYEVRLHVREQDLGTVLSALSGSASLVSVAPTKEAALQAHPNAQPKTNPKAVSRYVNGLRNKGISGEGLVMEIMQGANRIFSIHEISNIFIQRGFAGNSCSPILSKLVKMGKIRGLGNGRFCLPGTLLHIGAGISA